MPDILLTVLLLVAVPIGAAMCGAWYCAWMRSLTGGRDPWFTLALAGGLAALLFTIYCLELASELQCLGAGVVALAMLLFVRRTFGIANDLEEYGVICVVTVLLVAGLLAFEALGKKAEERQSQQAAAQASPANSIQTLRR